MTKTTMKGLRVGLLVAALAAAGGAIAWVSTARRRVEHARYEIEQKDDDLEVRRYAPRIVAETTVRGPSREALTAGFRRLAGYIFGANHANTKVAMTTPVGTRQSQRIAMTAPVEARPGAHIAMTTPVEQSTTGEQTATGEKAWTISFTMPSDWTLDTLPEPDDDRVKLRAVGARRYVAIRFSGNADRQQTDAETERLQRWMRERNMPAAGEPEIARYNPPWTPAFLRRNEVLIPLAS